MGCNIDTIPGSPNMLPSILHETGGLGDLQVQVYIPQLQVYIPQLQVYIP